MPERARIEPRGCSRESAHSSAVRRLIRGPARHGLRGRHEAVGNGRERQGRLRGKPGRHGQARGAPVGVSALQLVRLAVRRQRGRDHHGDEDPPSLFEREFPPISGDIGVSEGLLGKSDRLAQSAMSLRLRERGRAHPVRSGAVGQGVRPAIPPVIRREGVSPSAQRRRAERDHGTVLDGDDRRGRHARGGARLRRLRLSSARRASSTGPSSVPTSPTTGRSRPTSWRRAISFFLTDGPPDAELLAAAASNGARHARPRSAPRRRACSRRRRRAPTSRARSSSTSPSPRRRRWS